MSVPVRRPDFTETYPTTESFQQAMVAFEKVAGSPEALVSLESAMEGAPRPIAPRPDEGQDPLEWRSTRGASMYLLEKNKARILSEHEGLVKTLLLSVPKVKEPENAKNKIDPRHLGHLKSVIGTFGASVEYVVVSAPDQEPDLKKIMPQGAKVTFVSSPHFNVSIWIQDAHVAMSDIKGNHILLEGVAFNRFEDMSVADDVAAQIETIRAFQSDLYFQGGNILGGSDVTLVGRDYLFRNTQRHTMPTETEAHAAFVKQFGTKILGLGGKIDQKSLFTKGILSGYGAQPIFHIDMYVTRTGVHENGKEVVFLGRPRKAKEITGSFSDIPEVDDKNYDGFFEETAKQLGAVFSVKELPLWLTFGNLRDINKRQKFYNLTWNNAIVENDGVTKRVLLPNYVDEKDAKAYGVDIGVRKQLQEYAVGEYEKLGFTVRLTDSMEDLAWGDGAVHCMTKVLSRTPMQAAPTT